jgi:carboxymethylenebutenolidase
MKTRDLRAVFAVAAGMVWAVQGFAQGAQPWAQASLARSPRHQEWIDVKHDGRTIHCFVMYPEVTGKVPAVVMIHEIFGLTDWAKSEADEIAKAGYIAIAPDLLSGAGAKGGGTETFDPTKDLSKVTSLVSHLPNEQVMADLDAAADYIKQQPACDGHVFVAGFCWGGGKSFAFATHRHDLSAAFVFYGPPPKTEALNSITCPVFGFYAGNDARISLTVPDTKKAMAAAGKTYKTVIYDGAGHGFMRAGDAVNPDANEPNRNARNAAWQKMLIEMSDIAAK